MAVLRLAVRARRLPLADAAVAPPSLADVGAAIELVHRGVARRVVLTGLEPSELLEQLGAARAARAGVAFAAEHDPLRGTLTVTVGPLR